jgi:ELWxxDGT repeat protein
MRSPTAPTLRRSLPLLVALLLSWLGSPRPASTQVATLVGDLSPGAGNAGSFLSRMARVGERLVLVRDSGEGRFVLYGTDGTPLGTEPLGVACGEECESLFGSESNPLPRFVRAGGRLFWWQPAPLGECPPFTTKLWASDATHAGTRPLTDCEISVGQVLVPFGGRLFYPARANSSSSIGETRLWSSDGTLEGTRPIAPADGTTFGSGISGLTVFQGRLFVYARDPIQGAGLWVSDGTSAGTRLMRTLPSDPGLTNLIGLVATSTHLFFMAPSSGQNQLWASDGTADGTRPVSSFVSGEGLLSRFATPLGNRIFFMATQGGSLDPELWQSDGTPNGTKALTAFRSRSPFGESLEQYSPNWIFELGGGVLFLGRDDPDDGAAPSLWRLGPTPAANTEIVQDCSGVPFSCLEWHPVRLDNRVYFPRYVGSTDQEIWVTDGTPQGTRLAADPCPTADCRGVSLRQAGGAVYARIEAARPTENRLELWRLEDNAAGGRRVAFLAPPGLVGMPFALAELGGRLLATLWTERHGSEPHWIEESGEPELLADLERQAPGSSLAALGSVPGRLVFVQNIPQNPSRLWSSDGRSASALDAGTFGVGCSDSLCQTHSEGGLLYYTKPGGFDGPNLWRTDGTPTGTFALTDFRGLLEPLQRRLTAVFGVRGGRLYFLVGGLTPAGEPERRLWSTDGSALGTLPVRPLTSLPDLGIEEVSDLGNLFYFVGTDAEQRPEIWRSNLSDAGTFPLTRFEGFVDLRDGVPFHRLGERTVFLVRRSGLELWATDGTVAGTELLSFFENGLDLSRFLPWRAQLGALLYFWAATDSGDKALWRTDGTAPGTRLVVTVPSASSSSTEAPEIVATGSALFFLGRDAEHGEELWTSDGTTDGTRRVRDLRPGPASSGVSGLVASGSRVFFTFDDGVHGPELWTSDGTEAGTRLVHDLHPGPFGSLNAAARRFNGTPLVVANDRLYLMADDGLTGSELWSVPLENVGPLCADAPNGLCLQGNRFRAEATWRDFEGRSGVGTPVALTADTGYFWFFDPANVELITKQLDGRALNEHFWTFYGALSNVEYHLTLTDTETGLTRRFFNPPGLLASVADTESFGPRGAALERFTAPPPAEAAPASWAATSFVEKAASGSCAPSATTLCLAGGRFAVEATWRDFQGNRGTGQTRAISGDTGAFWFFAPENLEVVLKVLDGTALNGKFWVFYGALSNVEYQIVVTDTLTGASKTYRNPAGRLASEADTSAF